ncbi:MAG: putative secreted protein, partial [Gammaproteobacteria bacterium]
MTSNKSALILLCACCSLILSFNAKAELLDQGLNSIMLIIDKALVDMNKITDPAGETPEADAAAKADANSTIVNLSRTLGSLSYSRLQCGEAEVLAEFTQRVQLMPTESQDAMRGAFQAGFDKSKNETILLSEDECKRLTQSRKHVEVVDETNVIEDDKSKAEKKKVAKVEKPPEDPKLRHLRVAELTGQLAYKHKACSGDKVFNRDYNNFIEAIPEEYQEEVKTAY